MTDIRLHRRLMALGALLALCVLPARGADSAALDMGQLKGKVVLLDFWASWCAPCLESFPWMQEIQQRYADRGLVVLAVNLDHDRQMAERFVRAQAAQFPVVYDPQGRLAERFHVSSMPSSFYIDRQGQIRFVHAGFRERERAEAERQLAALVAEQ